MKKSILIAIVIVLMQTVCFGKAPADGKDTGRKSIYPARLEDAGAVYFTPENFNIKADGKTDVSEALQQAITEIKTK